MKKENLKYAIEQRIFPKLAILFTAFALLFGPTIAKLSRDWLSNGNYSHGFLVPLITGYMIWQKKAQLEKIRISPNNFGLLVVICGMFVFIVGNIGAELFITRTAIVLTVAGLCLYFFGPLNLCQRQTNNM